MSMPRILSPIVLFVALAGLSTACAPLPGADYTWRRIPGGFDYPHT